MNIFVDEVNQNEHIIATYYVESDKSIDDAAFKIAVGQSIGNPDVRSMWETQELIDNHCCKIIKNIELNKHGIIEIAFPLVNLNWNEDGVSQLLCFLMGGHLDIDSIKKCHLIDLQFPNGLIWNKPKYGIKGIRTYTNTYDKPLLGGIIKPKTGVSPQTLLEMVKQLCDNGVNFIKEDEILGSPIFCTLKDRADLITNYIHKYHPSIIYCYCINGDYPYSINRIKYLDSIGANGIHINFWSGLGIYKTIRDMNTNMFIHFQKSGDKILTGNNRFNINWTVICKLAGMMGVDFIHAGMWGGYSNDDNIGKTISVLHEYEVMPALSCGMHPGLVNKITELFGNNYMANVGGAIHGHPKGTESGVKAMRQAIDKNFGKEYYEAINKWGII